VVVTTRVMAPAHNAAGTIVIPSIVSTLIRANSRYLQTPECKQGEAKQPRQTKVGEASVAKPIPPTQRVQRYWLLGRQEYLCSKINKFRQSKDMNGSKDAGQDLDDDLNRCSICDNDIIKAVTTGPL